MRMTSLCSQICIFIVYTETITVLFSKTCVMKPNFKRLYFQAPKNCQNVQFLVNFSLQVEYFNNKRLSKIIQSSTHMVYQTQAWWYHAPSTVLYSTFVKIRWWEIASTTFLPDYQEFSFNPPSLRLVSLLTGAGSEQWCLEIKQVWCWGHCH